MKTIEILAGTHIDTAARMLVEQAPARAVFNEIEIKAFATDTDPAEIVSNYDAQCEARRIAYEQSPEGHRRAAESEARRVAAQATVDACLSDLPCLDFGNPGAVLAWVERIADAADHVGVVYDRERVEKAFSAAGWWPSANCGLRFDEDDARNYAGWIVGQWLASGYPAVGMFAEKWRERFCAVEN
jgi:hypothetical protein